MISTLSQLMTSLMINLT